MIEFVFMSSADINRANKKEFLLTLDHMGWGTSKRYSSFVYKKYELLTGILKFQFYFILKKIEIYHCGQ